MERLRAKATRASELRSKARRAVNELQHSTGGGGGGGGGGDSDSLAASSQR